MSDDLEITRATPDADLQRQWAAIVLDLRAGRRGITDSRVYEVLFQRKIRRLEWMPAPEAEAIARDETLKSLHTIARQQVDLVEGQLSPGEVMQLMSDRREGKVRRPLRTVSRPGCTCGCGTGCRGLHWAVSSSAGCKQRRLTNQSSARRS